jgi:thiamine-monophosphate kinase
MKGEAPPPVLASRHHNPTPRVRLGRTLAAAGIPTAMIDLSDGLVADLGHILTASRTGAEIELAALPLSPEFQGALAGDPELIELALSGGEDYELLFAAPPENDSRIRAAVETAGVPVTAVGRLLPQNAGCTVLERDGGVRTSGRRGFNHFAD